MNRYKLHDEALADLDVVYLGTLERFGIEQVRRNADTFERAFQRLADDPWSGHLREDLAPAGTSYRFKTVLRRFMIVHVARADGVDIHRILDGSRDVREELRRG